MNLSGYVQCAYVSITLEAEEIFFADYGKKMWIIFIKFEQSVNN